MPGLPPRFPWARLGLAALVLLFALLPGGLRADPVPVKGKSGTIIQFEIQKVTATGFVGTRKDNGQTITVTWQHVDLDWLKQNQPDLYKSYTDASQAPAADASAPADAPAAEDSSSDPAKPDSPAAIVAQLMKVWRMNTADFSADSSSSKLTYGTNTRTYRLSLGATQRKYARAGVPPPPPPPTADPAQTNVKVIILISDTNTTGIAAYRDFLDNKKLRDAMTDDVEAAVAGLQPYHKGATYADTEALLNEANSFQQSMQQITDSGTTVNRNALENVRDFVKAWSTYAKANAKPAAK